MSRTDDKRGLGALAAVLIGILAALAAAAPAAAETAPLVPPGNSAVNQYTEAFPTAGGDRDANHRKGKRPSAKHVIGERNAEKLRKHGAEGEAVADLTAETAPAPVEDEVEIEAEEGSGAAPAGGSGDGGGSGEDSGNRPAAGGNRGAGSARTVVVTEPDGSSGLGEVIARATGSSSGGGMGVFLPLLILATIVWAFAYLARQKRPAR